MISLIDADSLIYIIAWNHKEHTDEALVKQSCDNFLRDIVTITRSAHYIGAFSDTKNFRHIIYEFAPYKGNRPEKPEWVNLWAPVIKEHYMNKHGFMQAVGLEADDIVSALSRFIGEPTIICSPDKDLKQCPGLHYDYRAQQSQNTEFSIDETISQGMYNITEEQAYRFFWTQVLTGDMGDNVYGVVGLGEAKANKLLDTAIDPIMYPSIAKTAYIKAFGPYFGPKIFEQTVDTLMTLYHKHSYWTVYLHDVMKNIVQNHKRELVMAKGVFDI